MSQTREDATVAVHFPSRKAGSEIITAELDVKDEKLRTLLAKLERRVVPTAQERRMMQNLSQRLLERTQKAVQSTGLDGATSLQGSVGKDTWLHAQADLDIFVQFPATVERSEWTARVLPVLREEFDEYQKTERYAEHPFLELITGQKVRVNIVPCYRADKGKWLSATDRTPYHKEYMNSKLTDATRLQVRFLKRFCMGIEVYGAEIKTGGFSGMLVETLILFYGSLSGLLRNSSRWKAGSIIDIEHAYSGREEDARQKFSHNPIVVVDPVDPDRNLAAAVRPEKLWSFVGASRALLADPDQRFFYPPPIHLPSTVNLRRRLSRLDNDLVALHLRHGELVPDILWGQLYRLERSLAELMRHYGFSVIRTKSWNDGGTESVLLFQLERYKLAGAVVRQGPPVEREAESMSFLAKHQATQDTISGPWIEGNRWMVEKQRLVQNAHQLMRRALSRPKTYNLTIPTQLEHGLKKKGEILLNEQIAKITRSHENFGRVLSQFLDGRPRWMLDKHSKHI